MKAEASNVFRFYSRLTLAFATGVTARNARDLLEGISTLEDSVIYYHTYRFVQEHQFLIPEPPNDFSYWATEFLQDDAMGERLAAVDTVRFDSIKALRGALQEVLRQGISGRDPGHTVPLGKEFAFLSCKRYSVATRFLARNLSEFADCLKGVTLSSLYLHLFESRLRPPLGINDFSLWFRKELEDEDLARFAADLDPYCHTLEDLRNRLIARIQERISHAVS